jgi:carbohydrate kinase (thermoresistant glucokinase family)
MSAPIILVVMGVSSSGKTTIGLKLAEALDCAFVDGDDLHPAANIDKMSRGEPLDDADRAPWLARIAELIDGWRERGENGVVTCSALKRAYREVIIGDRPQVRLVYLKGSFELIHARMEARLGHFMPVALLQSQFDDLEPPSADERPVVVGIEGPPDETVAAVLQQLNAAA